MMADIFVRCGNFEAVLMSLALKSTALLVLSFTIDRILLRNRLIAVDTLWATTLVMLVVLPFAETTVPRFVRPIEVSWPQTKPETQGVVASTPTTSNLQSDSAGGTANHSFSPINQSASDSIPGKSIAPEVANPSLPVLCSVYVLGVLFFGVRLIHAMFDVTRIRRSARPVLSNSTKQVFSSHIERLGIRRKVLLLRSPDVNVPLTLGWLRPAVVLPESTIDEAEKENLEAAMIHELVHVVRNDYLIQILGRVVQCFYWYNPMSWIASKRMRSIRERTCDGYCVSYIGCQETYVTALFSFAHQLAYKRAIGVGLAMAGTSRLEQRVSNLSPLRHHSASPQLRLCVHLVALFVTTCIGLTANAQNVNNERKNLDLDTLTIAEIVEGVRKQEQAISSLVASLHFDDTFNFRKPGSGPPPKNMIEDDAVTMTRTGTVDWEVMRDGRGRYESSFLKVNTRFDGSKTTEPLEVVSAFDGEVGRIRMVRNSEEGIPKSRNVRETKRFNVLSSSPFEFTSRYCKEPVSEAILKNKGKVAEVSKLENRAVVVVECETVSVREDYNYRQRIWIDPQRSYVVVRKQSFVQRGEGKPWALHLQVDSREFAEISPRIWLPTIVESLNYHVTDVGQSHLVSRKLIRVSKWSVNEDLNPSRFTFELSGIDRSSVSPPTVAVPTSFRNMRVRTVDNSGKPVSGTRIYVNSLPAETEQSRNREYRTDDMGYAVVRVPDRPRIVRIWTQQEGYVPLFANWEPRFQKNVDRMPEEFSFTLPPGTSIGGTVVNDDGTPIENAIVEVMLGNRMDETQRPIPSIWLAEVPGPGNNPCITDADGRWILNNVPEGPEVIVRCKLTHPECTSDTSWGGLQSEQNITMQSLRKKDAKFVMHDGIRVVGKIVGAQNEPIPNAVVIWGDDPYDEVGSQEVQTSDTGRYTFPPLKQQTTTVTVVAPGWMPTMKMVEIRPDLAPLDFQLQRGKTLTVKFLDTESNPIPNVFVSLRGWRGKQSIYSHRHPNVVDLQIPIRADDSGVYEWEWAPEDDVHFAFSAKGYRTVEKSLSPNESGHTITLLRER